MTKFAISYSAEIVTRDAEINPDGCCSIAFENLGTLTAYVFDNIPIPPNKIREFVNESNCVIQDKIRLSYRGQHDGSVNSRNYEQIIVTKTFATEIKD